MKRNTQNSVRGSVRTKVDGLFITDNKQERGNGEHYTTCVINGTAIRVWGAASSKGLPMELVRALRPVVQRIGSDLPLALMADHHPADYAAVGLVAPSRKTIVPDLIGGDCGCGVRAVRLTLQADELSRPLLNELFALIGRTIPAGTEQHSEVSQRVAELAIWEQLKELSFVSAREARKLQHQLGTLGGGNHFIELGVDQADGLWILIHSGSRYLGGLLRQKYQGQDIGIDGEQAEQFLRDQAVVLAFARLSRMEMADQVLTNIKRLLPQFEVSTEQLIDCCHNFVEVFEYGELRTAVHRKGACSARASEPGIVPGSMSAGAYLTIGRGSAASYYSSAHGAGRAMSRRSAFQTLKFKELERDMEQIVWAGSTLLRDEAPRAYKDLKAVLAAQSDLTAQGSSITPLLSFKGGC